MMASEPFPLWPWMQAGQALGPGIDSGDGLVKQRASIGQGTGRHVHWPLALILGSSGWGFVVRIGPGSSASFSLPEAPPLSGHSGLWLSALSWPYTKLGVKS